MPIAYHQLVPANAGNVGYAVAKELARQTVAQFGAVRWVGVGIAGGSCCAALAVAPNGVAGYPAAAAVAGFGPAPAPGGIAPAIYGAALPYGIVYGNSQLAPGGLALGPLGGHAERASLTAANGIPLYMVAANNAVLFVELMPCGPCQAWLNGGGGGVVNPYNGVINGGGPTTLNVWWRWQYPGDGGVIAMNTFHALTLAGQLLLINGPGW